MPPASSRGTTSQWIVFVAAAMASVALVAAPQAETRPAPPVESSDFASAPWSLPAIPPQTQRGLEWIDLHAAQDARLGRSIQRGVDFMLLQFRDGGLATAPELSESQRQALDALCVYALAQAGLATNDPRLNPRGGLLPAALDRLCTFDLTSDAQKMNHPLTYGRSLRATSLAVYDRPADRAVLKNDVAWLIKAQIGGGYTYDDFYNEMVRQGFRPRTDPAPTSQSSQPSKPATMPSGGARHDFAGGSTEPGLADSPYPPTGPTAPRSPAPPVFPDGGVRNSPQGPPTKGGQGGSGQGGHSPPAHPYEIQPLEMPQRITIVRSPMVPWWKFPGPNLPGFSHNGGGGKGRSTGFGWGSDGAKEVPARGDNQVPKLELVFEFPWDNSNSQYGLLGVWAGAEVGIEVPDQYWIDVEKHWLACEFITGQWGYRAPDTDGYFAMTCAGVASLLVTHEYLDLPMLKGAVGREPYSPGLTAGIHWLDQGDNGIAIPNKFTHYLGYDLFGIERVGLASGYKFFGNHDWYREMSDGVVALQNSNGSWGREDHGIDTLVDTAYSLLFLSRGRHPILMTKLKFDKYWDNRPRDVANLAKFASKQLERQINWQVVGIDHNWYDWFDSPVVFIASHQAPHLAQRDYAELRKFVQAGGMILTHADLASANFDRWVPQLAAKIAPGLALKPIPPTDPIYSLQYKLPTHRPLLGVSNGVRWLLVHSPNDLAMAWQQRSDKTRLTDFQLGMNIFLYASGKPDLRNRIDSPFLPAPPTPPTKSINLARLRFQGNWNPEPAAWPRFSRYLQWETGQSLNIGAIPIEKLTHETAPIASLTGTGSPELTKAQHAVLGEYVREGGILVIDPCGGDNDFKLSIRENLLPNAFAGAKAVPLPPELSRPMKLRPYSLERLGGSVPQIQLLSLGKGCIVLSPLDLTAALLDTHTWGIDGYQPESAEGFLKDLVNWSQHK